MGSDLSSIINMGALAVSQLLETAQEKGTDLVLETAAVENQVINFITSFIIPSF